MPTIVTWPKRDNLLFQGRNGSGYQTGISIREGGTDQTGLYLDLVPINSRGYGANCSITVPEDIDTLLALSRFFQERAELLIEARQKARENTQPTNKEST